MPAMYTKMLAMLSQLHWYSWMRSQEVHYESQKIPQYCAVAQCCAFLRFKMQLLRPYSIIPIKLQSHCEHFSIYYRHKTLLMMKYCNNLCIAHIFSLAKKERDNLRNIQNIPAFHHEQCLMTAMYTKMLAMLSQLYWHSWNKSQELHHESQKNLQYCAFAVPFAHFCKITVSPLKFQYKYCTVYEMLNPTLCS